MSLMGKIFTLLIFFMSICFLVISVMVGASHRNWKDVASRMQQDARAAKALVADAKDSSNEQLRLLSAERVSRALQLSQLESQLKRAREDFITKEAQYRKSTEISQQRLAELEQINARIKGQDEEIERLKQNNSKLVDDIAQQYASVRTLTSQTYELQNQIELLEEKESDILAKLAASTRVLKSNGLTLNSLTSHIPPKVDGIVLRIGGEGNFVAKLGSDDGVRVDHVLDIYRNDRFIGKGTVVRTQEDLCVLKIVKDYMKDSVREGDHVTSKL